jgi:hypothetical protein
MLFHMLIEIILTTQHFVADRANQWLFFGVLSHVVEQLVKRRKVLLAHAAAGRMVVCVRSKVSCQVVLLIEGLITKTAPVRLLARMRSYMSFQVVGL